MNTDKHFSLLASLCENNKQHSGGPLLPEDVGTQVPARNLLVGDVLNGRPPLGLEVDFLAQPIRNQRLLDRQSIEESRDPVSQLGLASGDLDSATKGSNVIWLHERQYKAANDYVKKAPYVTGNKAPYMLDFVAIAKKRAKVEEPRSRRVTELRVWADNRTAVERLNEAYEEWAAQVPPGEKSRTQGDLVRACNLVVGNEPDQDPPYVSQPMISQLQNGGVDPSSSALLDVIAEAMGFRSVWIRTGTGERKPPNTEAILNALRSAGIPIPR